MKTKPMILLVAGICIIVTVLLGCGNAYNKEDTRTIITDEQVQATKEPIVYDTNAYPNTEEPSINKVVETEKPIAKEIPSEPPEEITNNQDDKLIKSLDFDGEESEMLMKIAMAEAGGEGKECMAFVMLTVLNRTWSSKFPNSIHDVIFATNQFTPVTNGAYNRAVPNNECKAALELVMSGWNESKNSLYFESCSGSSWHSKHLEFLFQCGKMRFYK